MNRVVIHAEGLGKRYRRGQRDLDESFRDTLTRVARSPLSVFRRAPQDTFWALRDASLEVREGEILGLIGRNGAGKTTLLKILSRITRPTAGWAEIHGRVRSLLEVGTGFHPELTGRENTYLSGSILGMTRGEIDSKFDEIVAFAEIDKFIDTPVKHYSSGMFVRLGFAVAAHLEPEILLVDEVLAVGDIKFQKKCLGKMGDVARAGRTVVLVSHQMIQMRRLCHRVAWVDGGQIRMVSETSEVVSAYEALMNSDDRNVMCTGESLSGKVRFLRWEIVQPDGSETHVLDHFGPVTMKFTASIKEPIRTWHHGIGIYDHNGQILWGWAIDGEDLDQGEREFRYTFPSLPLRPGPYTWLVSLHSEGERLDAWECKPEMVVATKPIAHRNDDMTGILNLPMRFAIEDGRGTLRQVATISGEI
jgi:lipopolysaccharide transport system ATP-binding protein